MKRRRNSSLGRVGSIDIGNAGDRASAGLAGVGDGVITSRTSIKTFPFSSAIALSISKPAIMDLIWNLDLSLEGTAICLSEIGSGGVGVGATKMTAATSTAPVMDSKKDLILNELKIEIKKTLHC